jgi:hypothetical protein
MIGYSIPSLFETRVLFHAEFRFAIVNAEAGLPACSCLDFQDDFNRRGHAQKKTCQFASSSFRSAAAEFQKILVHPGIARASLNGAVSQLRLARAQKMMGDVATARKSYEDFLNLWKGADPDIPIYRQTKAEYAKRQNG